MFTARVRLWRVSDWRHHLRKHLGINSINYFMYDERPQSDPPTPQSSCISIKPVGPGLVRMVSLKGGLRRVVIQQLRLLVIVGLPIPRYDLQNGTLQMQKQTASG